MKKWNAYNSELTQESYDVIIIGSGVGGLCTAALLSMKGKKVLVLEKHFKIGGWTHTFRRKNYEWDVGIHYIGKVHNPENPIRKLFDLISDGKLEWCQMNKNYDRIIFPDQYYNFVAPRDQFINNMLSYFPNEESAIKQYMKLLDETVKSSRNYFMNKAISGWIGSISYQLMNRKFFKYSDRTTLDVLSSLTNNKKLIGVLTGQWGDYGLPPGQSSFAMHALVAHHYLDGGNYPRGTSRKIAETISDFIEKNGGKLVTNAAVKKIKTYKNDAIAVIMENGDVIESKKIISSIGVVNTLNNLLDKNRRILRQSICDLDGVRQTKSYVCLHVGLNGSAKDLGLENTNLWVYSDYDHDKSVKRYLNDKETEFPLVYISFPSAKDDSWEKKHPNSATMEAITLSRWKWYENWENLKWKKRGVDYEDGKEKLSKKIMNVVFNHVNGIENSIDYQELSTPLTVKDLANYQKGEMYGIDHSPERFRQSWLKPQSKIKNLYFTGQDITTVGVSSALFSGLLTASVVLKENLSNLIKK